MNEPLDPKVALAYASIAGGLGCLVAGVLMNNPSTLAVGAGLLGAPGVVKGVGGEPQGTGEAPDAPEESSDSALAESVADDPALTQPPAGVDPPSASVAAGHGEFAGGTDVTAEFTDGDLEFEEE